MSVMINFLTFENYAKKKKIVSFLTTNSKEILIIFHCFLAVPALSLLLADCISVFLYICTVYGHFVLVIFRVESGSWLFLNPHCILDLTG